MSKVTAQQVAALRATTGAGVMDARDALRDAHGDADKAARLLRERGLAKAAKKSAKDVQQGRVHSYVHNGRIGVLIELRCETDFVARNEEFVALANDLCLHIVAHEPPDVDALLAQQFVRDETAAVKDVLDAAIAKLGENIRVMRFTRYESVKTSRSRNPAKTVLGGMSKPVGSPLDRGPAAAVLARCDSEPGPSVSLARERQMEDRSVCGAVSPWGAPSLVK